MNVYIACAVALFLIGCGSDRHSEYDMPEIVDGRSQSTYHIVKKGETLDSIAKKYATSKNALIRVNKIKPPYAVYPRQRIKIIKTFAVEEDKTSPGAQMGYGPESGITIQHNPSDQTTSFENASLLSDKSTETEKSPDDLKKVDEQSLSQTSQDTVSEPKEKPLESTYEKESTTGIYSQPVQGKIVQRFGQTAADGTVQESLSIQAPPGTKVKSVADGEILRSGKIPELREWGNIIIIKQKDGRVSVYGFLKDVHVKKGQKIVKGQSIGTVGMNKAKNKSMLVYQLRDKRNGKLVPVDPLKYFS